MKLKFDLSGHECNEYPFLTIKHNDRTLYSDYVSSHCILEYEVELKEQNQITLQGIGKSHGVNGKWDTVVDSQGQIIQDKYLIINNIFIDDIAMGPLWIGTLLIHKEDNSTEPVYQGMWTNGHIRFNIMTPVLDWIIQEKFINPEKASAFALHGRSGENKFEYEYIQDKISAIQQMINDQNSNL